MIKQRGATIVELLVILIVLFGAIGWVWNLVKIVESEVLFTGLMVLRLIGVFLAPVGAILGYF